MADFAPDLGIQAPNSMVGDAGHPASPNQSFASLFGGLTDAVTQTAGVTDTQNLFDIKDQAQTFRDNTDKLFGYDSSSVPSTVGAPTNTPPELSGAAAQMSKLQAARAQGKLTDSHYWALLQSNVKDLKSKYAGYSDQIDNIVQQVTGANPANQVRASIEAYNQKLAAGTEDTVKNMQNYIGSSPYLSQVAPDYYPGNPKYADPATMGGVYQRLHALAGQDQQYTSTKLAIGARKDATDEVVQDATNAYGNQAQSTVYNAMNAVGAANGVSGPGSNFFAAIKDLQDNPSPDKVEAIRSQLNKAEADVTQKLQQMHLDEVGSKIKPQDLQAMDTAALAPLKALREAIDNKDYGAAARFQRDNEAMISKNYNTVLKASPQAMGISVLTKINPAIAANYALDHGDAVTNMMQSSIFNPVQAGVMTPDQATSAIQGEPNLSPAQKNKISTTNIKGLVGSLVNPQTPGQLVKQQVGQMFKPDNSGTFQQTWAATSDNSKGALLNTILTPSLVDRVASVDPQSSKNLAMWAFNRAQEVPEIRAMAGQIGQTTPYTAGFVYNPNTHQFLAAPPKGAGDFDPGIVQNQVTAAQAKVAGFNKTLASLAYSMQKAGIDPNDANNPGAIPAFLRILGASGQSGDVPALQKAMEAHADNSAGDTPRVEANLSDAGPSFDFLSDPQTAQGFKDGSGGDLYQVIRQAEGGKSGYDASVGDNGEARAQYSNMTVSQVLQAQQALPNSKAVGGYQLIPSTLHYAIDKAGVKLSDKFDAATQDKLASVLMEDAGLSRWKAGKLTDAEFQNNLAQIWAGLPETSGMSHYEGFNGNHATVTTGEVAGALKRSRA